MSLMPFIMKYWILDEQMYDKNHGLELCCKVYFTAI